MEYKLNNIKECIRLNYLQCQVDKGHSGELLNQLCIDSDCKSNGVICPLCETENHIDHKIYPLKLFLLQMEEQQQKLEESNKIGEILNTLNKCQKECLQKIQFQKGFICQEIEKLEEKVTKFYEDFKKKIQSKFVQQGSIKVIMKEILEGKYQDVNQYMIDLKNLLDLVFLDEEQNNFQMKTDLKLLGEQCYQQEQDLSTQIQLLSSQINNNISNIEPLLKEISFKNQFSNSQFKFHPDLKGKRIELEGELIASQGSQENGGERFALLQPNLPMTSKRTWGIKVKKFKGWVGVGIGLKKKLTDLTFKFKYENVGHGSYLISTNGYSWSSLQKEYNSAFKSFTFAENDIVYIEFDPFLKKIRFNKNGSSAAVDQFTLDIEIPLNDEYCPVVNLCSPMDAAEIVNSVMYKFT